MLNTSLWLLELQISLYPQVMFIQSDCFFWFQDIFWKLDCWISQCGIKTESICEYCSLCLSSFPVAGTVPQLYSARKGGGGRGTKLYKPYRYVPPQRVWYLGLIGLKTGIHLPILVWNRVWFSNYRSIIMKYLSFQFQMNKNDAFEEFFCLRSNLSNYDIISD